MQGSPKALSVVVAAMLVAGCMSQRAAPLGTSASSLDFLPLTQAIGSARLEPRSGTGTEGLVVLSETPVGLRFTAKVVNASPGLHGIHIHEKGDCSAPDASSAGPHWNPGAGKHGFVLAGNAHAGDFGNVPVDRDGEGLVSLVVPRSALAGVGSWSELVGKAVVVHSGEDDFTTDPAGNSGDRIACGVLVSGALGK